MGEAEVLQWIGVADNDILPAACTWVYPTMGIMQFNKQNTEKAKNEVKKVMGVLNQHLLTHTYLVGERITQADISVAMNLKMLYTHVMDPAFRAPFPNVNRWFMTCVNQFEFKNIIGKVELCEKMAQFDSGKYKFNDELKQGFKAVNLIGGMFQRLDKLRKHAFACVLVLGEEGKKLEIEGVWLWRGQDLAFPLCEDWTTDYECYDWTKLDIDQAADKLKVQEFFAAEGSFDGRKVFNGKCYK